MYFVPHGEFSRYEPNYRAGNLGFAYVNWRQDKIYKARILVTSTNDVSQTERSHLIREELTQAMGLLKDSLRYADSIFYQGWTSTTDYSPLDQAVIQMLYSPEIRPGMDGRQVEAALGWAAEVHETSLNTGKVTLEGGNGLENSLLVLVLAAVITGIA